MDTVYSMLSFLTIKKDLSEEVQKWLDNEHLKDIRDTDCFIDKTIKNTSTPNGHAWVCVSYRHTFQSEEAKNRFRSNYQQKLKRDFLERYKNQLDTKEIEVHVLISEESEL